MQKKKGISLIVLVITIIVMIILAAAIILSLNNAGIIGNANKAVSETDYKNIQTAAQLAYADILLGEDIGLLQSGEYIKQQLISDGMITEELAKLYKFRNNGEVVKLQTKSEYEELYKNDLELLDETWYTIKNGVFSLTTAGKAAATDGTIERLVIPYGVTEFGSAAIKNCKSLIEIVMPDTVNKIGNAAFSGCVNLKTLKMSKNIAYIDEYAFYDVVFEVNTNNGLVIMEDCLIDGTRAVGDVIIPNNIDVINYNAFQNNTGMTSVYIPDSIYNIPGMAFYNAENLAEIKGAKNIISMSSTSVTRTKYYNNAEEGPMNIGKVLLDYIGEIPSNYKVREGTVVIASGAFNYSSTLQSITIPKSVKVIESLAFYETYSLTNIIFEGELKDIKVYAEAFRYTGITGELKANIESVHPMAFEIEF